MKTLVCDGPESADGITEDALFGGALRLLQPAKGHRAGTDAVLLAASLPSGARRICDLGAASGVVGLRAAMLDVEAHVTLVERDSAMVELARRNVVLNGLGDRVSVRETDVFRLGGETDLREAFDGVLTNPPFFEAGVSRVSPNANRAGAHVTEGTLDDWLRNAATLLAPGGYLVMIHRADTLSAIVGAMSRRFGALRLRFIHPVVEGEAIRLIIAGKKGSRAPLGVLPPLILMGEDGRFTSAAAALHDGQARLDMLPQKRTGGKSRPS
jgi:tRNA1(Val) A37 N6-methylase TrmN6